VFDKITIRAKVSNDECVHLAQIHHLQSWTNERGTQVDYRSSDNYKKFTGISVKIQNNTVTLSTSLHKYWNDRNFGQLRNDNIFTISEAKAAFEMLLFENGLLPQKTKVVLFEIGLNMPVSYDPITFIELVRYLPRKNDIKENKIMFIDANYKINRQKTSEKHKDIRRYFKIYDKTWEMKEKKREKTPKSPEGDLNPSASLVLLERGQEKNILRIETVYRRKNERSDKFFTDENINRLVKNFWIDWKDLFFFRTVRAYKGARKSEVERASIIINNGTEAYLEQTKADFEKGKITAKQYRTIREFIRDYEVDSKRFKTITSPQENEYNSLLFSIYNVTRK
jgi:hypothetical protein